MRTDHGHWHRSKHKRRHDCWYNHRLLSNDRGSRNMLSRCNWIIINPIFIFFVHLFENCSIHRHKLVFALHSEGLKAVLRIGSAHNNGWLLNLRGGGTVRNVNKRFVFKSWITIFLQISGTVKIFFTVLARHSCKWISAGVYVQQNKKHAKLGQF